MANDIDKTSPHYKGEFGSIYEVNQKFPNGGVAGDYVEIDGWAHYWNADRGTWCVNAQRDSYWDELITGIIEKFKLFKGATYMGVAGLDTVPAKAIGAKMYYFATVAGTYKNFGGLVVPQGINVLYSENGSSWVNSTLLEVAQELGLSTWKVVSQKALNDALELKANQSSVNEALSKKANTADVDTKFREEKKRVDDELAKKFDKESIAQESGDSEELVMSQKAVSLSLSDLQVPSIKGEFLVYPKYVLESDPTRINPQGDSNLSVLYFKPQKRKYITNIKSNNLLRGLMYLYKGTMSNFTYVKSITFETKDNLTIDLSNETEDFDFALINYKDENKKWEDHFRYAQCGSVQDEELSEEFTAKVNNKLDKSSVLQELGDAEDKVISQKVVTNNLLALLSIKGEFLVYPKYVLESDPTRINPQGDSNLSVLYFKPQKRKYITNIKSNNLLRGLMYLYKGTMSNFTYVKSITFETKDNLTIDLSNETEDFDFALINYKDENKKWEDHFRYAQCGSVQDEELYTVDNLWINFAVYPYYVLESDPSRVNSTGDGILHVLYFQPDKKKYITDILKKSIWRGLVYLYKGTFTNKTYVKSIMFDDSKDNPVIDLSNETEDFDFALINYKDENKKWADVYKYKPYVKDETAGKISNNQWYEKKICIIGTSVAHGSNAETAYGYIAQQRLGFNMIPAGVPGQAIHGKIVSYTENGTDKKILSPLIYGSGALTKSEYAAAKAVKDAGLSTDVIGMAISESPNNPNNWAGEDKAYNNYYRTWENLFTEDNKDVALWIYATIPNNNNYSLDDWNNFDTSKWAYKDGTTFEDHRTTFLGAMLYLMDKMYSVQPTARMVLVIDSEFNYELGKNNFKLLSETYNIPIIDLWSKINTSPKSLLQLKSFNGTNSHPSTFGHEIMGNIFTNELLLIS